MTIEEIIKTVFLAFAVSVAAGFFVIRVHHPRAVLRVGRPSGWERTQDRARGLKRLVFRQGPLSEIEIATDGSFIDTALFLLAARDAVAGMPPAEVRIRHVDWAGLPYFLEDGKNAVAYMNRRAIAEVETPPAIWSNLGSYHGYALVGRAETFPESVGSLKEAHDLICRRAAESKLRVITFGSDSVDVLKTPLTPVFMSDRIIFEHHPASNALARFLSGKGDLFVGGLPQRLECKEHGGLVELFTSDNNPLMFGIEVMVYSGSVDRRVLEQLSASWSRLVERLAAEPEYRLEMYRKWVAFAQELRVPWRFSEDSFVEAAAQKPGGYLNLYARRDDAAVELIAATKRCLAEAANRNMSRTNLVRLLDSLHEIYLGPARRG